MAVLRDGGCDAFVPGARSGVGSAVGGGLLGGFTEGLLAGLEGAEGRRGADGAPDAWRLWWPCLGCMWEVGRGHWPARSLQAWPGQGQGALP